MVGAIKEICIFIIIAQAVMFFVPGNSYMKYVRILVGILMILKITEPVFGLFLDGEKEREIRERIMNLEQNIDLSTEKLNLIDNSAEIYGEITDELVSQLNDCNAGYKVLGVELNKEQKIIITVAKREETESSGEKIQIEPVTIGGSGGQAYEEEEEKIEELKQIFAKSISADTEKIEIVFRPY